MWQGFLKLNLSDWQSLPQMEVYQKLTSYNRKEPVNIDSQKAKPIFDGQHFQMKPAYELSNSFKNSIQNSFMVEHRASFENSIRNYREALRNQLGQQYKLQKTQQKTLQCKLRKSWLDIIKDHEQKQNPQEVELFQKWIFKYEKLSQYLEMVCQNVTEQMSASLILLACQLLEKKTQVIDSAQSSLSLLHEGCHMAQQLKNQGFEQKCKDNNKIKESYFMFLKVYCTTTLLVAAQFFQNPFYSGNYDIWPKRGLQVSPTQEEQQQKNSTPQKLRKYSF